MPWSGATGASARCKRVSTAYGRKRRSGRVLHWICGVKRKPKAVNTPLPYFIVHELDKPGNSATVSVIAQFALWTALGHREVRQDKCLKLRFGELDRNRRRCRLLCWGAHHAMTSWEEW